MDKRLNRVCMVNQTSSEQVIYRNDQYICMMKLFPTCDIKPSPKIGDYRRFHLRFYLPREILSHTEMRIEKLIIMTNGLDEIYDFDLYDELGSRLATRGIASILLPLADHLNRHTQFRKPKPTLKQIIQKPSDILMQEGIMLFERYLQFRNELNILFHHIIDDKQNCTDGTCKFYHDLFSPNTQISLLGYSLGSVATLSYFLERLDHSKDVNTCFLLSAAVTLRNTKPNRMLFEMDWDKYVGLLEEAFQKESQNYPEDTEEARMLFGAVCFARNRDKLRNGLRKYGRRVLFLFGAKDSITGVDKLTDLEPPDWGLAKIVLPGINHFLAVDEEFKQWIDLIVNLIIDFEKKGAQKSITLQEVILQNEILQRRNESSNDIVSKAENLTRRSKYLDIDPDLIPELSEERKNAKTINYQELKNAILQFAPETKRADPKSRYEAAEFLSNKKFGQILYRLGLIKAEDLAKAIELQRKLQQNGKQKRIGEILVDPLAVLRIEQVEVVASTLERSKECLSLKE